MILDHDSLKSDKDAIERAMRVRELMNVVIRNTSAQKRDRRMQVYLAQARGKVRNGDLLRQSIDFALRLKAAQSGEQGIAPMDDALVNTLTEVADALEAIGVTYAVTGSIASSVHGEPFSSLDVDVILTASARETIDLADRLSPRFYAPRDMLVDAAERSAFANVVDNRTGLKVDLSFVGKNTFLKATLRRRVRSRIGSHPKEFWFVTAEDVILMKLLWRRETRSAKQWENALGVATVKGARMDWKYLFEQAELLGIENDLAKLRDEAGI